MIRDLFRRLKRTLRIWDRECPECGGRIEIEQWGEFRVWVCQACQFVIGGTERERESDSGRSKP